MFGSVMTGTGPAVGSSVHPAFQSPKPVPKFPVERERIIPIQVMHFKVTNKLII
jgi:hypothetical protein